MGSHSQKVPEHPIWYFQIGVALPHLHNAEKLLLFMCSGFSMKVGADTTSLTSSCSLRMSYKGMCHSSHMEMLEGSKCLGSEGLTDSLHQCHLVQCQCMFLHYIWWIWHLSFISMISEDGTDWVLGGPRGLGITVLYRNPGEGGNAS